MTTPREQHSLFGEILDWMLAPLLLLWPMSIFLTYLVAQNISDRPYDRELGVVARAEGMAEIAKQAGLTRPSLYKALSQGGRPEFSTVLKVINALGLKLKIAA